MAVSIWEGSKAQELIDAVKKISSSSGLSNEVKIALLTCFRHVAWDDDQYQVYYDALENALNRTDPDPGYPKIIASFNQDYRTIYTDDPINSLKNNIIVKKYENIDDTDGTIISDYTILGTLKEGNSIVNISSEGLNASLTIPCVLPKYTYTFTANDLILYKGGVQSWDPDGKVYVPFLEANNTRRGFITPNGTYPLRIKPGNTIVEGHYPIHIPSDATSVTISVSPNTMQVACNGWEMDFSEKRYRYISDSDSGFSTGGVSKAIPLSNKYSGVRALGIILKFNSSGSTFTTEPTQCTVTFS